MRTPTVYFSPDSGGAWPTNSSKSLQPTPSVVSPVDKRQILEDLYRITTTHYAGSKDPITEYVIFDSEYCYHTKSIDNIHPVETIKPPDSLSQALLSTNIISVSLSPATLRNTPWEIAHDHITYDIAHSKSFVESDLGFVISNLKAIEKVLISTQDSKGYRLLQVGNVFIFPRNILPEDQEFSNVLILTEQEVLHHSRYPQFKEQILPMQREEILKYSS